jgi:hypothetical protein
VSEPVLIAKLNLIASEIKHEDDLIGQRTTWLVISQSFLFGTFVAVVSLGGGTSMAAALAKLLIVVIPFVGVLLPVVVLFAVYAAAHATQQWRAEQDRLCEMPEGKQLDWPRLKHRTSVLGAVAAHYGGRRVRCGLGRDHDHTWRRVGEEQ